MQEIEKKTSLYFLHFTIETSILDTLPESRRLPSVRGLAECKISSTQQTDTIPNT
jgi:hypothetical protein